MSDIRLTVCLLGASEAPITLLGRAAWALKQLITAGGIGCTPTTHPGPRWSHYVHVLRKAGLSIETIPERHGGQFPGVHARYVLRSPVTVLWGWSDVP